MKFGTYSVEGERWQNTDDPNFGRKHVARFKGIDQQTEIIPLKIGTRFGARYLIEGQPKGRRIQLQHAGIHPELSNPSTGKTFTNYKYSISAKIGEINTIGYTFDHDWELVPGKWTFQVFYQNKVVLEKQFTVIK
ncbi:MAG: DUF3859 domain-containing protein [Bacteroidetes bacterium]|nr:DUF3859 domain-containing protein [Bacteroidota bacterium]